MDSAFYCAKVCSAHFEGCPVSLLQGLCPGFTHPLVMVDVADTAIHPSLSSGAPFADNYLNLPNDPDVRQFLSRAPRAQPLNQIKVNLAMSLGGVRMTTLHNLTPLPWHCGLELRSGYI